MKYSASLAWSAEHGAGPGTDRTANNGYNKRRIRSGYGSDTFSDIFSDTKSGVAPRYRAARFVTRSQFSDLNAECGDESSVGSL